MARTSSPARRKTSARWRTAVVLPVPPFWERTAILCATLARLCQAPGPRGRSRAERARIPQPGPLRPSPPRAFRPEALLARRLQRLAGALELGFDRLDEVQSVAPDDDLVAVRQHAPFDALAVDEDAVQAAVVEDAHAVRLAHDQRMPARDRRV